MCVMLMGWSDLLDVHAAASSYLAHKSCFGSSVGRANALEDSDLVFALHYTTRLVIEMPRQKPLELHA